MVLEASRLSSDAEPRDLDLITFDVDVGSPRAGRIALINLHTRRGGFVRLKLDSLFIDVRQASP